MSPPPAAPTTNSIGISLTSVKPAGKKKRKTTFRPGIKGPAKKKITPSSGSSTNSSSAVLAAAAEAPTPKPPPPAPPLQSTAAAAAAAEKPTGEASSPFTDNNSKCSVTLESVGEITATTCTIKPAPAAAANSTSKDDDTTAPIESAKAKAPPAATAAPPVVVQTSTKPAASTTTTTTAITAVAAKRGLKRKKAGVAIRTTRSRGAIVVVAASRYSSNDDAALDPNSRLDETNHHGTGALIVRNNAAAEAVGLSNNIHTLGDGEDAAGGALTRAAALPADSNQNMFPESNGGSLLSSFCSKFPRKKRAPRGKKGDNKNATNHNAATGGVTAAAAGAASSAASPLQDATAAAELAAAAAGPVVQIVNGEIVLQEDSMVLNANASTKAIDEEYTVVEEEAQLAVIGASYNSFIPTGKRSAPKRWSAAETELFYEALRQVGADFGTMEAYFSSTTQRTRKQLKSKYLKEMAHVPHLIEAALHPQLKKKVDLTVFDVTVTPRPVQPAESSATVGAANEQESNETLETTNSNSTKDNAGSENEPAVEGDERADTRSRQKDLLSVLPPLPSSAAAASKTAGLDNDDEYDDDDINNSAGPSLWPEEEQQQGGAGGDGGVDMANDDDDIVHDEDPLLPDEKEHVYSIMDHGDGDSPKQQQQQQQQKQQQEEEPTTISLVSTAFGKKKASKKPKFRSRKKVTNK